MRSPAKRATTTGNSGEIIHQDADGPGASGIAISLSEPGAVRIRRWPARKVMVPLTGLSGGEKAIGSRALTDHMSSRYSTSVRLPVSFVCSRRMR